MDAGVLEFDKESADVTVALAELIAAVRRGDVVATRFAAHRIVKEAEEAGGAALSVVSKGAA